MNRKHLINELDDLIYVSDLKTHEILFMNEAAKMRMGLKKVNCVGEKCFQLIQGLSEPCTFCANHLLPMNEFYDWEYANTHMNGCFLLKHKLINWNGQLARMEVGIDITKIQSINNQDALTGVSNRKLYLQYLNQVEEREPLSMGVLLANINALKKMNDYYGYEFGDLVVKSTGDILKKQFGSHCVFRLSGDEFIVLSENIEKKLFNDKVHSIKIKFNEMDHFGVSIGYTWAEDEIVLTNLINHADELMCIEKQQFYIDEESSIKRNRPKRLKQLLRSIENNEYEMYLQPKTDMVTGDLIGAEALVRYIHPEKGVIPPSKFIPTLERERTIRYIDFFMYEQVCKMMDQWHKQGRELLPISLNFSRATILESDFMDQLLRIYRKYEIPYNCIEIEITESMGEMEKETLAEISGRMKAQGFAVSLDDFGSQYTNMAILTIMDFDTLKLDRSLVSRLEKSQENRIVVQHVIEMCKEMGVRCLAEGVENENQKMLLREMGCDFAQGYLFNKPLPVSSFEARYFKNHKHT